MVEKKCNTLLRPSTWDDPYEMNYSNSVIATQQGDIPLTAQYWFGQSWSLCEESIIMWQAFKRSDEPYVKIKVDIRAVFLTDCAADVLSVARINNVVKGKSTD